MSQAVEGDTLVEADRPERAELERGAPGISSSMIDSKGLAW
jgi:hypothetical protein